MQSAQSMKTLPLANAFGKTRNSHVQDRSFDNLTRVSDKPTAKPMDSTNQSVRLSQTKKTLLKKPKGRASPNPKDFDMKKVQSWTPDTKSSLKIDKSSECISATKKSMKLTVSTISGVSGKKSPKFDKNGKSNLLKKSNKSENCELLSGKSARQLPIMSPVKTLKLDLSAVLKSKEESKQSERYGKPSSEQRAIAV